MAWQTQERYDAIRGRRVLGNREGEEEFDGSAFTISDAGRLDCALPAVTYFAQQGEDGVARQQQAELGTGALTDLMMRAVLATGEFGGDPTVLCSADENQTDVALGFGPAITATLAAWTDERAGNQDVRARLIARDGGLGRDMLVHPAPGDQQEPQVAYNPDDDEYLVVWQDHRKGAGDPDIYAQRVSGDGALVGENITVTNRSYRQIDPHVAYAAGGQVYLVAWQDYPGVSNDYYDAYGQLISRTGVLIGSPIAISARSGPSDRESPTDIVYNSISGEFLVLWSDLRSGYWSIYGKQVSITGTVGSEIQVTFEDLKNEDQARGVYNPDDDQYLVVYTYRAVPGGPGDVLGRRMTGSGSVTTTDTIEIAVGNADQQNADAGYLPGLGRYVAVWQDDGSGNADIYGRLVSPEGTLDGSGYAIASESQEETRPRLSADGGWPLVVWQRSNTGGTGDDLYGRRLWADGRPADDEPAFTLVEAAGDQESPAVAGDGAGGYLVAWQDDRNGDWDIYSTTLQDERRVIAYEYDGLYRLMDASYSTGEKFAYDYDAVGNREAMTVTTPLSGTEVTTYTYDAANRLTYVGGVALTWDDNGNLLEDHEGTVYAYDTANRLIQVVQDGVTYTFSYNATGDRLSQSVAGAVTTYTLDLYGGLTQVLGDGTSVYLYGLGRIGEEGAAGWLTHLGDALGSVRQLADADGDVVGDRSYRPYGGVLQSGGSGASAYGFAGEWTDGTGLVFLRARYMDPGVGRFVTLDPVTGSPGQPVTLHRYLYAGQDPINHTDPTGLFYCSAPEAGCVRWVLDALEAIQSAGARGSQLVQSFRAKDQDLKLLQSGLSGCYCVSPYLCSMLPTAADMPGLRVVFTDSFPPLQGNAAMSVWPFPETQIYVKLHYFDPPNKPSGDAVLLFAHELVHVEQGNWLAFSILGEVLAYRTQAELRALIDPRPRSPKSRQEEIAEDILLPADGYGWREWQLLSQGLLEWESQFPAYAIDPLFPLWDNPFPEPIDLYPRPQPDRPPTPPVSVPSPPEPPGTPTPP